MRRITILGAGIVTVLALGFGASGAVAADNPSLVDDVAARLGISADKLRSAFKDALSARVDAAVKSGKLTADQGAKLKERIANAKGIGTGVRDRFEKRRKDFQKHLRGGIGHRGARPLGSGAAAKYIGISGDELRTELRTGKSLAQIATAHDKSVDGLVTAMLAPAKDRIDKAVENERLTQEQADKLLSRLQDGLEKLVQRAPKAKPTTT